MVTDPSEKTVKEPGPGAPDRVMVLADLPCNHPLRGCTVVLPPKQRSREIFHTELGATRHPGRAKEGESVWLIVSTSCGPKGVYPPAPRSWRRAVRCPW